MREGALIAGKYRLRRRIGEGAVGEVWAALNERTEREVALKVIAGADRELRERAVREARACGRVSHRNVVEILDAGETEQGDPFLAMQLLHGETLGERMRRGRLFPSKAAAIALDVARGLTAAHAAGIVHRDLKPSNIFLHREPETGLDLVKVLDFGVSKMLKGDGPPTTRTGDIVGSPAYMSPEQARAEGTLDHRTDLWSLGVVLFEMITGERPFPSHNIAVISEIVSLPIPSVSSRVPDVDPRLSTAVARCLERDLGLRVQNAQELAALLRPLAAAEDARGSSEGGRRPQAPSSSPSAAGSTAAPAQAAKVVQDPEEDQIPTLALASSVVPAAVAAAIAAQAEAPSSSRPFRPVPTTLVDRSKPPPGTNPAAMPGVPRVETVNGGYPQAQARPPMPRVESPSAVLPAAVPVALPLPWVARGPLTTQRELDDELSTEQLPPGWMHPLAQPQSFAPVYGAPALTPAGAPLPAGAGGAFSPAQTGARGAFSPAQAGAGTAVNLPPAPGRFGLKKGDATLFLVGVMIVMTLVGVVAVAFGLRRLISGANGPPLPPSTSSASTGAEPQR